MLAHRLLLLFFTAAHLLDLTLLFVLAVLVWLQVVRREGKSRGFGFVTFREDVSVEKCLLVNHFIKNRKVELKRAVPKVCQLSGSYKQ